MSTTRRTVGAAGTLAVALTLAACGSTDNVDDPNGGDGDTSASKVSFGDQICTDGGADAKPGYPEPFTPADGAADRLSGAGSSFVAPVMSVWADTYASDRGVEVAYQSIGSGGGIEQIVADTVDFGASDTGISAEDMADSKNGPDSITQFPLVAGAVVITYNLPGVPSGLKFDGPTIGKIFAGQITTWNDDAITALNPDADLPDTPIAVAHRSDGSGTTGIFTHYLTQTSPEWVDALGGEDTSEGNEVAWPTGIGGQGNEGVSGVVGQTEGGIGYVELQYALAQDLTYGQVENRAGTFVQPCVETITAATDGVTYPDNLLTFITNAEGADAYPIAGDTYAMLYTDQDDPATAAALVNFFGWVLSAGQDEVTALDYVPLGPDIQAKSLAALAEVTVNGEPVVTLG